MKVKVIEHARYGKCRVSDDGWFVGRDIARILGYANADAFVRKHVAKEDKRCSPVRAMDSTHSARTIMINRTGLNAILAASANVESETIKAWLLSAVVEETALVAANLPKIINDPDFGQMRWVMIDGEVWFVAVDMCRILGLQNPTMAVAALDEDERAKFYIGRSPITGGGGETNIVNEYGLYRLIMASNKPEAKVFQRKVYHEILPSINKYGYYSVSGVKTKEADRLKKQLATLSKFEFAVVYLLLMSNGAVKIGYTSDLTERVRQLKSETGLEVLNFKTTAYMPLDEARALEAKLKEKYAVDCIEGEYYDTRFIDICKEI